MTRPFRSAALAVLLVAAGAGSGTVAALAQAPAPRAVPDGFVLPGPAPTGAATAAPAPSSPATSAPAPASAATSAPAPALAPSTGAAAPAQSYLLPGGASTTRLSTGAGPRHDWPCVQRRIDHVDERQVWSGPALGDAAAMPRSEAMRVLVETLTQRRVPPGEAAAKAAAFVADMPPNERPAAATALFADLFARLNGERSEIMRGIERYGARQQDLAVKLREANASLSALRTSGDAAKAGEAQEALLWDTRIFEERRRSLTYVCEVPTLIEQRLFALGRALAAAI